MTERTELIIGHARGILLLIRYVDVDSDLKLSELALDAIRQRLVEIRRLTG